MKRVFHVDNILNLPSTAVRLTILILFLGNKKMMNMKYKNYKRKVSHGDKH